MSNEFIGRQVEVGISVESVRNTAETSVQKWLKKVRADLQVRAEKVIDNSTFGRLEFSEGARNVKQWYDGTLEGILHSDAIGYLLYNLYGTVDDGGSSGGYTHDFSLDQTITHQTLTFFTFDGDVDRKKLNGGMISTLEITASVDDYVRFTAEVVALSESSSSETPEYDVENDFIGKEITIRLSDTAEGLASATIIKAKNATIKFDTGLIRDHVFGSVFPDGLYNAMFDIEIDLTLNYTNTTFKDLLTDDTYSYLEIAIEGAESSLVFNFQKVSVIEWARSGDSEALIVEEVKLKAFYNTTDESQSLVSLTNKTPVYSV